MKLPICDMVSELTSGQPFWPQRSLFTEAKLLLVLGIGKYCYQIPLLSSLHLELSRKDVADYVTLGDIVKRQYLKC